MVPDVVKKVVAVAKQDALTSLRVKLPNRECGSLRAIMKDMVNDKSTGMKKSAAPTLSDLLIKSITKLKQGYSPQASYPRSQDDQKENIEQPLVQKTLFKKEEDKHPKQPSSNKQSIECRDSPESPEIPESPECC